MKFEIKVRGSMGDCKKFLDKFIQESKEEYLKQTGGILGKLEKVPLPISVGAVIPIYDCDYFDLSDDTVVFWNTLSIPKVSKILGFANPFKKMVKKMEKNLESYLKANGIECSVKYAGDK